MAREETLTYELRALDAPALQRKVEHFCATVAAVDGKVLHVEWLPEEPRVAPRAFVSYRLPPEVEPP